MQTTVKATHQVINDKRKVCYQGTPAQCEAWIRLHRAEFFCKTEVIPSPILTNESRQCWTLFAY